ncbi:hypothetical protein J7T55_009994 [Diaporthe amygdali]|uniref:uncharacterized protein n=1 Tax=Phomopsis amygdali TaxID=1214568 RepID=UPI0022FF3005|nr:uncharacterized protein J7T55_009994 [Diaporthe amygdali]KAJ0116843.1 hypothetical protein J7T55_009994 [Diaporthe amygdali]
MHPFLSSRALGHDRVSTMQSSFHLSTSPPQQYCQWNDLKYLSMLDPRQCKKQDSPTHADYTLSETSEQSQMFPSTAQSPTGVRRTAVWQRWLVASGDTTWRLTTTWPRASPAPFCDKTAQRRSPAVFDLSSCDMPCDAEMPARNDTGPAALEHKRNFARVMSFGKLDRLIANLPSRLHEKLRSLIRIEKGARVGGALTGSRDEHPEPRARARRGENES